MRKVASPKNIFICLIVLVLIASLSVPLLAGKDDPVGAKKRVIIGAFKDKASHHWYHGVPPGTGMSDMLISALQKTGKFRIFAREQLQEILAEKKLSESDLANPGANAALLIEIGDYLVSGSITEFGYKEKKIGGSKFGLGKLGYTEYTGRMAVDLKLIDIGTSEVLFADNVDKSEKSRSLGVATSEFSFGSQNTFDDHVVGKATRKTINGIVKILEEQIKPEAWSGAYLIADEGFLLFEAGSEMGIKPGMKFNVKRVKKEIKNKAGKVIKVIYEDVGVIEATEVEEGITTCKIVSGSGFANDDLVTPRKK